MSQHREEITKYREVSRTHREGIANQPVAVATEPLAGSRAHVADGSGPRAAMGMSRYRCWQDTPRPQCGREPRTSRRCAAQQEGAATTFRCSPARPPRHRSQPAFTNATDPRALWPDAVHQPDAHSPHSPGPRAENNLVARVGSDDRALDGALAEEVAGPVADRIPFGFPPVCNNGPADGSTGPLLTKRHHEVRGAFARLAIRSRRPTGSMGEPFAFNDSLRRRSA